MTEFLSVIQGLIPVFFAPHRIPLAMAALLLASVFGLLSGRFLANAIPFFWILTDRVPGWLGGRLDRVQRNPRDLMLRGLFLTLLSLPLFYAAGCAAAALARAVPAGGFTEIVLLSLLLAAGSVWAALLRLYFALKTKAGGKIGKNAYYTIAVSTRTDLTTADDFTMTRVGMGLAARSFDKGVVGPLFWFLIGGLPLAFIYAGLVALVWRFGRDGFGKGFGRVSMRLEWVMGVIPTGIAGLFMALAGLLTPTGGMTRAFAGIFRKKGAAPYAEGGLPVTAMANALNVSLGGPVVDLDGRTLKRGWIGPESATAQLGGGHLRRAIYISIMAHLLLFAGMGLSLIWLGRIFA